MAITVTAVPHSSGTLWMRRYSVAFFANQESKTALIASRSCSFTSWGKARPVRDRKSTRLNSSHGYISYAVFCLKKKKKYMNYDCQFGNKNSRMVINCVTSEQTTD